MENKKNPHSIYAFYKSTKHDINFKQAPPSQYLTKYEGFVVISFFNKKLLKGLKGKKVVIMYLYQDATSTFQNAK